MNINMFKDTESIIHNFHLIPMQTDIQVHDQWNLLEERLEMNLASVSAVWFYKGVSNNLLVNPIAIRGPNLATWPKAAKTKDYVLFNPPTHIYEMLHRRAKISKNLILARHVELIVRDRAKQLNKQTPVDDTSRKWLVKTILDNLYNV